MIYNLPRVKVRKKVTAGSLAVGSTVKLNVGGAATNFIVVHQGLPSSLYNGRSTGTWLLMKDCYENSKWNSGGHNGYASSTVTSYLNKTFLKLFDATTQAKIKEARIPYALQGGGPVLNSFAAKIFLLSGYEVGLTADNDANFPADGAKLSYFASGNDASANRKRIAKMNGYANTWWLRSPYGGDTGSAWLIRTNGDYGHSSVADSMGIRPALILSSDARFDAETLTLV